MKQFLAVFFVFFSMLGFGQRDYLDLLNSYNDHSIPYISVDEIKINLDSIILVDARSSEEYAVSHIKNSILLDSKQPDFNQFLNTLKNKEQTLIIYCSIGVRSEKIAKQLKKLGYQNIYNLYGGIFEWYNLGNPVVDSNNIITNKVHAYSKKWSKHLIKAEKIYD